MIVQHYVHHNILNFPEERHREVAQDQDGWEEGATREPETPPQDRRSPEAEILQSRVAHVL